MADKDTIANTPTATDCVVRPAANPELIQVAVQHPQHGWIGADLDRRAASKLATELQAFADFRSTPDVDA